MFKGLTWFLLKGNAELFNNLAPKLCLLKLEESIIFEFHYFCWIILFLEVLASRGVFSALKNESSTQKQEKEKEMILISSLTKRIWATLCGGRR